jgi:tagaturonate reductase
MPVLLKHYESSETAPELFALGFAAYIYFMKGVTVKDGKYYGELNGVAYLIQDEQAEPFYKRWAGLSTVALAKEVLKDVSFWGSDLNALPGFCEAVTEKLSIIINSSIKEAIETTYSKKGLAA